MGKGNNHAKFHLTKCSGHRSLLLQGRWIDAVVRFVLFRWKECLRCWCISNCLGNRGLINVVGAEGSFKGSSGRLTGDVWSLKHHPARAEQGFLLLGSFCSMCSETLLSSCGTAVACSNCAHFFVSFIRTEPARNWASSQPSPSVFYGFAAISCSESHFQLKRFLIWTCPKWTVLLHAIIFPWGGEKKFSGVDFLALLEK